MQQNRGPNMGGPQPSMAGGPPPSMAGGTPNMGGGMPPQGNMGGMSPPGKMVVPPNAGGMRPNNMGGAPPPNYGGPPNPSGMQHGGSPSNYRNMGGGLNNAPNFQQRGGTKDVGMPCQQGRGPNREYQNAPPPPNMAGGNPYQTQNMPGRDNY